MQSLIFSILLDDKCQFWLNKITNNLTSPYFGSNSGSKQLYYHNLNCTWLIKAEQGTYVNFEIHFLKVKNNTFSEIISMIFLNDNHSSSIMETT